MTLETQVQEHYASGALLARIRSALEASGVDPDSARPEDLKPVDEFHIGGVAATRALLEQLDIGPDTQVLDIGSGIGGTPRFVASATGATVTGLDLTPEFVETATALSQMVGMDRSTQFRQGSALDMPFEDESFDLALLLHVGMNLPDKARLMSEAARVLKPGATFAVYDVMKTGPEEIDFPVPWAETPETSFLATLDDYRAGASAAGFTEIASRGRREAALGFFAEQRARIEADGPPVIGIHLLMGDTRAEKVANMVSSIGAGRIEPTELILRTPG